MHWKLNKKLQVEVNLPNAMVLSAEWRATTVDDVIIYSVHQFGGNLSIQNPNKLET
jgi:hypothetical protein